MIKKLFKDFACREFDTLSLACVKNLGKNT